MKVNRLTRRVASPATFLLALALPCLLIAGVVMTAGTSGLKELLASVSRQSGTSQQATAALTAGPQFSAEPQEADFLRAGPFAHALIPIGPTTRAENAALARALVAYEAAVTREGSRDAVEPLVTFLTQHPNSAWRPALMLNLGSVYRQTGHFSKALDALREAWALTRSATGPSVVAMRPLPT